MTELVLGQIGSLAPFNEFVYRVCLRLPKAVPFQAGQYLQICLSKEDKRPFSIASAPGGDLLELHIGASEHDSRAMEVIKHLERHNQVELELPLGNAYLHESERPLLLVAGGTGFSYVKSIVETLLQKPMKRPVFLYWGGREESSLYLADLAKSWAADTAKFNFVPVLETPPTGWSGRAGSVLDAISTDFVSLEAYDVYVAGRFEMAGAARQRFFEMGLPEKHLFGDAYAFI
jgi:aquacobalamin reductase/NAD(P)H-flavin reductase